MTLPRAAAARAALLLVLGLSCAAAAHSQTAAQGPGTIGTALLVYEEQNKNIDPWRILLADELKARGYEVEAVSASQVGIRKYEPYSIVVVYGSVMAFATKEPIRDWLKRGVDLEGKKVALFVTANRWFLAKYLGQLKGLLGSSNARIVDAVSTATKNMKDEGRAARIKDFVGGL
jgi:hypothetical protein